MTDQSQDIGNIFAEALSKSTPEELAGYLDGQCGSDAHLRAEIESLLASHENADTFLKGLLADQAVPLESTPTEQLGTVIGRYKLLEKIGEGGMAVVYMAQQERPIRRKVALKVIKVGMDTHQVIARFEAERQALAIMDHPNIAKVFDVGATDTGRPYFAMELVHGVSITEFCNQQKLPMPVRLGLFSEVCNAVQHAHQRGIIHRDLKPSNIMVTMHDDKAMPKVIDFGIAKATNQRLTEKTLFTRYAQMIGTPAYMSPEQAQMSGQDIDTRSDIYSLGVLLYELLTGSAPFGDEALRQAGYLEMQRIISEEEPVKPSTKLSTLGDTLTEIAKQRCCTPELLHKTIRGDLDWIVMKSLEKNRTRRYETASTFKRDIQHYLQHEPVEARKPGVIYRLQKYLYRNRVQITVGLAVFSLLSAVTVIAFIWQKNQSLDHKHMLANARETYAGGDLKAAMNYLKPILRSRHVGLEARLLHAVILVENGYPELAMDQLHGLLGARPKIAGAAHALWARILTEQETTDADRFKVIEHHQQKADALLPATAEAYFLRAMMTVSIKEKLVFLEKALELDRGHYEACRLRTYIDYASKRYTRMKDDALEMTITHPDSPLGYTLRGLAQQGLEEYGGAIGEFEHALRRTPEKDPRRAELHGRLCEAYLCASDYPRVIEQARRGANQFPTDGKLHFHVFCALSALGDYQEASDLWRCMTGSGAVSLSRFRDWSKEYVFDVLDAKRRWHTPDHLPQGGAFLPMLEAEEDFKHLSAKGRRIISDGFAPRWSPDGTKLAYGLGMLECSGIAVYDCVSQETELLIVPGKDPAWSPNGHRIAFVREARTLHLADLAIPEHRQRRRRPGEVWIMQADGTEPRRLAQGFWPTWSQDGKQVYYIREETLYSIAAEEPQDVPQPVLTRSGSLLSISPDGHYVAYVKNDALHVFDLASHSLYAQCPIPPLMWGGQWSPESRQFSLGSFILSDVKTGLWIYDLDTRQITKTLDGMIASACWSPDRSKLAISPPFEIWLADIDPQTSASIPWGAGRSFETHFKEMVDFYTRRIASDSNDIANYLRRAECYHALQDQEGLRHDMDRYVTVIGSSLKNEFQDILFDLWQSTPKDLGRTFSSSTTGQGPSLSPDGQTLYFNSNRSPGYGNQDLWMTSRDSHDDHWHEPVNLGLAVNSPADDWTPDISPDGLSLYFTSNRAHGLGDYDIYVSTRATTNDPWGDPVNLGSRINSPSGDGSPSISANGLSLFFGSFRAGGHGEADLWITTRATLDDQWNVPVNLGPSVNRSGIELDPDISSDGLTLLFSAYRSDGAGGFDIWMTWRDTITSPWNTPLNLGPAINKQGHEGHPTLSSDKSTLYFNALRPGNQHLWQVPFVISPQNTREDRKEDDKQRTENSSQ